MGKKIKIVVRRGRGFSSGGVSGHPKLAALTEENRAADRTKRRERADAQRGLRRSEQAARERERHYLDMQHANGVLPVPAWAQKETWHLDHGWAACGNRGPCGEGHYRFTYSARDGALAERVRQQRTDAARTDAARLRGLLHSNWVHDPALTTFKEWVNCEKCLVILDMLIERGLVQLEYRKRWKNHFVRLLKDFDVVVKSDGSLDTMVYDGKVNAQDYFR